MVVARGTVFEQSRRAIQMGGDQIGFAIDIVIDELQASPDPFAVEVFPWGGIAKPAKFAIFVTKDLRGHLPGNILCAQVIDVTVDRDKIEPAIVVQIAELATETQLVDRRDAEF